MTVSAPKWDLNARVEAVLRAHEHPGMTDARLSAMRAAALAEFRAALRDCGTDPDRFKLTVHIEELVRPMAFVAEPATGKDWPLATFNAWLKQS